MNLQMVGAFCTYVVVQESGVSLQIWEVYLVS